MVALKGNLFSPCSKNKSSCVLQWCTPARQAFMRTSFPSVYFKLFCAESLSSCMEVLSSGNKLRKERRKKLLKEMSQSLFLDNILKTHNLHVKNKKVSLKSVQKSNSSTWNQSSHVLWNHQCQTVEGFSVRSTKALQEESSFLTNWRNTGCTGSAQGKQPRTKSSGKIYRPRTSSKGQE